MRIGPNGESQMMPAPTDDRSVIESRILAGERIDRCDRRARRRETRRAAYSPRPSRHRRRPQAAARRPSGTPKIGICDFERSAPVHRAAEGVVRGTVRHVARTDAGGRKAAHQIRTHL